MPFLDPARDRAVEDGLSEVCWRLATDPEAWRWALVFITGGEPFCVNECTTINGGRD
jgi:hypothetical protein